MFDTLVDMIHDHRNEGGDYGAVYLPPEDYNEIQETADLPSHSHNSSIYGVDVYIDGWVERPRILPKTTHDLRPDDLYQSDPPERLVGDLVTPEERQYTDELRGNRAYEYRDYAFYEVTRRRQELDHDKIEKYDLEIVGTEPFDYDREVDETVRVKFGFKTVEPVEAGDAERELAEEMRDPDYIERELGRSMREQINSVSEHRVTGIRRRKFRFPYPCLDFEHTEEHHAGWQYVHYGRLFMQNIDTEAQRLDVRTEDMADS